MTDTQARLDAIRRNVNAPRMSTASTYEETWRADQRWLLAELERVTAALRERDDALTTLRGAWNHHMDSCEQHQALQIPTVYEVAPVFEQIREWMNAPSATASAMPASSQGSPESALRIVRSIAVNGPGPDTTPEQTLATIAAFIDKRLAGGARAAQEDA
jgi:hypothetical protein